MNVASLRYRDLQVLARNTGRNTQELLVLYVLEGFLSRVVESPYKELLILKGGVLLSALNSRRPTRDIDFAALNLNNDEVSVLKICCEIVSQIQNDGIEFNIASASSKIIRDEDEYSGVRVSMFASIDKAKIAFHVDINVGDPITPGAEIVKIPRLLSSRDFIELLGYPITMVLAEKIVTAVQRGSINTRWRDFGDIYRLSQKHSIPSVELKNSVASVALYRAVELKTLRESLEGFAEIGQSKYGQWRQKQGQLDLPEIFDVLLQEIYKFSDPVILGSVGADSVWNPLTFKWQ